MLKIINLETGYGALKVLHGVSLHVNAGQLVSVFGHNGSGKSTLIKAIMGEIPVWKGRIFSRGRQINGFSTERVVRAGIVLVPEGRELFADHSVSENLKIGAYARKPGARAYKRKLEEVFELFPILQERISQKAGTLSGGEQQMLAVARGMMSEPELLILDEPSIGLAPRLVRDVYEKIARLKEKGMTILLIEQNVHIALKHADLAYVLENGRIPLQGSGSELKGDPRIKSTYLGE